MFRANLKNENGVLIYRFDGETIGEAAAKAIEYCLTEHDNKKAKIEVFSADGEIVWTCPVNEQ